MLYKTEPPDGLNIFCVDVYAQIYPSLEWLSTASSPLFVTANQTWSVICYPSKWPRGGRVESSQSRERSDVRKLQPRVRHRRPADLGQNRAERSRLCFSHISRIQTVLQRGNNLPLALKIAFDHVVAIKKTCVQGPMCVMLLPICETSYSKAACRE